MLLILTVKTKYENKASKRDHLKRHYSHVINFRLEQRLLEQKTLKKTSTVISNECMQLVGL